ncbi:hypothetical protein U8V72_11395 [Priestia filamentosa]|uniref:hypothetical protein n=1 Tax=Priestia filamentosa TaxID=1402861 RepID=UPI00397C1152
MFKERNLKVLDKLKEYYIPKEIQPIYKLLREFPERLRFVKDHNGVKNLIFISTVPEGSHIFEVNYFSIITRDTGKNAESPVTKVSYTPDDILNEIKFLLTSTQETLFVDVGFAENEVTKEDYMEILLLMEETKCNIVDAYVTLRRFPKWYENEAELPFYINKEKEYFNGLIEMEREFLLSKKQEILDKLHKVVEQNNEKEFNKLSGYVKNINNQLLKYK